MDPAVWWYVTFAMVLLVSPLVMIVRRWDPPAWLVVGVGLALAAPAVSLLSSRGTEIDETMVLLARLMGIWCLLTACGFALLGLVAREPKGGDPNHPPRPQGLGHSTVLLGLIVFAILGSSVWASLDRGRPEVWGPAGYWLMQLPLALLAIRSGARAHRLRRTSALLAMGGAMLVWAQPSLPHLQNSEWWIHVVIAGGFIHSLLAGFGSPHRELAVDEARALAIMCSSVGALLASATIAVFYAEERLWWTTRNIDPADVPFADPTLPVGKWARRGILGPADQKGRFNIINVAAVAPNERLKLPPGGNEFFWLGLTPTRDVRVAGLTRHQNRLRTFIQRSRQMVQLHRAPPEADGPRYSLGDHSEALTMDEVRQRLTECGNPNVGFRPEEAWTAGELFRLCAEFGCAHDTYDSKCEPLRN